MRLLFDILDTNKNGRIHAYDLTRVSSLINEDLSLRQARKVVRNCSPSGEYITFKEFLYVMTRRREEKEEEEIDENYPNRVDMEDNEATPMASERMQPIL